MTKYVRHVMNRHTHTLLSMTKYVRHDVILRKCDESVSKVKCERTDIHTDIHTHTHCSQ